MGDLYLVFKNLTRKKMRLALTLFATFIAFMIFGTISAFQSALDSGVELSADDRLITVNKINFTQPLPIAYYNRVRTVDGIVEVTHLNWFGGYYQDPKNFLPMMAVNENTFLKVYNELVLTDEEEAAWKGNRQGLIVGENAARQYGWKKGDRIPINSNIFSQKDGTTSWDFTIEAVYTGEQEQTDTSGLYFHYKYFNETQSFGGNYIGWMGVRTADPARNGEVIKAIDDMFVNSPFETETVPEKAFNQAFLAQIGNLGLILSSVIFAAFFIILVIVGNSMILAIRERTSEIAVLKTIGFKSGRIFAMVLSESIFLALMGGGLGLLASFGLIELFNGSGVAQLPTLVLKPHIIMQSLMFMLLLGGITGIFPAITAQRLNIISALSRH